MKANKETNQKLKGVLIDFKANKHLDIDGLTIDLAGGKIQVKFPPHTALFIQEICKPGDSVEITAHEKKHPPHGPHKKSIHQHKPALQLVSIINTSDKNHFAVDDCEPPHPVETGKMVSFIIKKPQFTKGGKHGEITGAVFEGNYFHLHPEEYEEEEDALKTADEIRIKAKKRREDVGFVNEKGYTVYHTYSLELEH